MQKPKGDREPRKEKAKKATNAELVEQAIQAFGNQVENKKVTVSEFVRLLEIEKQMKGEARKEIKVTWVDPSETEPSSEK
jgi:hypothetical protein